MKLIITLLFLLPLFAAAQSRRTNPEEIHVPDTVHAITLTNFVGQTVYSQTFNTANAEVKVDTLPDGFYTLTVNGSVRRHCRSNNGINLLIRAGSGWTRFD